MLISTDNDIVSVGADEVVNEVMGDTYDDSGIYKEKYYRWLYRVWVSLNFDFIRTKREVIIPVHQGVNIIQLPYDFLELVFFGYVDDCGHMQAIAQNRNLAPDLSRIDDLTKLCNKCGQPDLCRTITQQQIIEQIPAAKFINFKGGTSITDNSGHVIHDSDIYDKVTTTELYPDGSYREHIKEPYAEVTETGVFLRVGYLTDVKTLCTLQKHCDACVTASPANLSALVAYCCTDAIMCCSTDGLNYPVKPGIAHYNMFEQDRYIKLSPNHCLQKAYLKYVSAGVCKNGKYIFPLVAEETLINGTYYLSIAKKKNVPAGEKERARKEYVGSQKILVRRLTRLSYDEWLEIVDAIPRIPSL